MGGKRIPTPTTGAEITTPAAAPVAAPAPAEAPAAEQNQAAPAVEPTAEAEPSAAPEAEAADGSVEIDGELVEVRVLLAFDGHQPNDVIEVPEGALRDLGDSGHVDSHPDAVAYARSLDA